MVQAEKERRVAQLCGSKSWTEGDARLVLEALAGSGETVVGFARRMKLGADRVFRWRKRLGAAACVPGSAKFPSFVPMEIRAERSVRPAADMGAVICIGSVRMEMRELSTTSAAWVARVMRSLPEAP
jgi:hypothetical protein